MRLLIAPDKFKGSLGAKEVGQSIAQGVRDVLPAADITVLPLADGGDGTAEVICDALAGRWVNCRAHDPLGREIDCRYVHVDRLQLAVIEMSEAAGMRRLPAKDRDPLRANTFGVGQMILHAARYGAREIIVGLGGSATNDGGFGMARALGYRFFAVDDTQLRIAVSKLDKLKVIERPRHLKLPAIVAATDVQNPLLGKNGSSEIYGPQKGADNAAIKVLECALKKFAGVAAKEFGVDYRDRPGAGAAGGLGFGLMMFAGALVRPGFDIVSEIVGLESKIRSADVVITGEGRLDKQTLEGKTPAGVARLARKLGKRIFAIVGEATEDIGAGKLFDGVYEVRQAGVTQAQSIETASDLLRKRGQELARLLDGGTAAG